MEKCLQCGKRGGADVIRRCSSCKMAFYCSRDCQKRHWSHHKVACRKTRDKSLHNMDLNSGHQTAETGADEKVARKTTAPSVPDSGKCSDGPLETCNKCGMQRSGMKKCGVCLEVTYCSRDCQRADWLTHKVTCQAVDDVITTEGYRLTEQREQAAERAKATKEDQQKEALHSLLSDMFLTPQPTFTLTWEEARSRAQRLYPRRRIIDKFRDLQNDCPWMGILRRESVVAVVKIGALYPHIFRHGRCLEDAEGNASFVLFHTPPDPGPYFRYDQLREGNFLCYEHAHMHFFMDGTVGFRIDEASSVHIMEPSKETPKKSPSTKTSQPSPPPPAQLWKEARSRAQAAFSRERLVDSFLDLDPNDLTSRTGVMPVNPEVWVNKGETHHTLKEGVVTATLLLRLESPISHSLHLRWAVQDRTGKNGHLTFRFLKSPSPHFRYEDLHKGHFLCVSRPHILVQTSDFYFINVEDASTVKIIEM